MSFKSNKVPKRTEDQQPQREMASVEDSWLEIQTPGKGRKHEAHRLDRGDPLGQRDAAEQKDATNACEPIAGVVVAC